MDSPIQLEQNADADSGRSVFVVRQQQNLSTVPPIAHQPRAASRQNIARDCGVAAIFKAGVMRGVLKEGSALSSPLSDTLIRVLAVLSVSPLLQQMNTC